MTTNFEHIEFTDTRPGGEWRSGTFFILPDKMVEDPNLSDAEYRVLSYLHRRAGNFNPGNYTDKNRKFCRVAIPTYETIAKDTCKSRQTVADIIYSLKTKGYIKIHHSKSDKGIRNVYTIMFPKDYETLNHVEVFTQEVATGKTMIKRPKNQEPEAVSEGSMEFHTRGSMENRTTLSMEFLTVNKNYETGTIETGTSTFLTERSQDQTESNQPEENQEVPLVKTNIPGLPNTSSGQDYKEALVVEEVPLVDTLDVLDLEEVVPSSGDTNSPGYSSVTSKEEEEVLVLDDMNEDDLGNDRVDVDNETVTSGPSQEFRDMMIKKAQEREKARIEGSKIKKSQTTGHQYIKYTNPMELEREAMYNELRREMGR